MTAEPEETLVTQPEMEKGLAALGVCAGMTLLVHTSLSRIGYVCGGAQAVILALESVLGPEGTLVMPTHTGVLSDPAQWNSPPVPESWWEPMRQTMPPYMPDLTPTYGMGMVAETFRKQEGVLRSSHPRVSFAAWGAKKEQVTQRHELDFSLGEGSPLARIYDLGGSVLLLGVGHANNTSLHLAEYRAAWPGKKELDEGCPSVIEGRRQWSTFRDIEFGDEEFPRLGEDLERETDIVKIGRVGRAEAKLMPQRPLVDYAVRWIERTRAGENER